MTDTKKLVEARNTLESGPLQVGYNLLDLLLQGEDIDTIVEFGACWLANVALAMSFDRDHFLVKGGDTDKNKLDVMMENIERSIKIVDPSKSAELPISNNDYAKLREDLNTISDLVENTITGLKGGWLASEDKANFIKAYLQHSLKMYKMTIENNIVRIGGLFAAQVLSKSQ